MRLRIFFRFIIETTLKSLFGIDATKYRVSSEMGLLGVLSAYFGVVEAQGRGCLHVHMLLWLKNAPNADEMVRLLREEGFRNQIKEYIQNTIRTHLDGFNEQYVQSHPRETGVTYSRPPNTSAPDWDDKTITMERKLARAYQVHVCKQSTCLRTNNKGETICKRGAPWPLHDETVVHPNGAVDLKRSYEYLNGYSPGALVNDRCNNDLKVITNGEETRGAGWYLTKYQLKGPNKTYNVSGMLASALLYHQQHFPMANSLREQNRLLIYRCFNVLNRQTELSGPQVISHLMGWGDSFQSHHYVPVYWSQLATAIKRRYPYLTINSEEIRER